jgi:hypothetical protein
MGFLRNENSSCSNWKNNKLSLEQDFDPVYKGDFSALLLRLKHSCHSIHQSHQTEKNIPTNATVMHTKELKQSFSHDPAKEHIGRFRIPVADSFNPGR